jgi:hypothetical protein
MKQLQLLSLLGMMLIASAAMADVPIYNDEWSTECVQDDFTVTVSITNLQPDLRYMVYRDLIFPDTGAERVYFSDEPIPAEPGETFVLSLNDPDINAEHDTDFVGRYVIEALWPDGSLASVEYEWLSCGETYRVARGNMITDYLIEPCTGIGMPECTAIELFVGDLEVWVGSSETLDFYGRIVSYDDVDDCSLQIYSVVPLGAYAPCEEPVAVEGIYWGGLKAAYR